MHISCICFKSPRCETNVNFGFDFDPVASGRSGYRVRRRNYTLALLEYVLVLLILLLTKKADQYLKSGVKCAQRLNIAAYSIGDVCESLYTYLLLLFLKLPLLLLVLLLYKRNQLHHLFLFT
jgi:hypothetical protein